MKNKKSFIFILLIILSVGIGIYVYNKNINKNNNNSANYEQYNATKVSVENTLNQTQEENKTESSNENSVNEENKQQNQNNFQEKNEQENLISEFSTKIYTKDKKRQNNISITCNSLNNTFVENGDTFSFCNTVGKATSSKGYKKAEVFKDGEVVQALGGGNCQVSSTLYNAVLKIKELKVIERHVHSNSVPYVKKGKDAAVAYGSYDFKFINNTGNKIKISSSCDKNYVYIKIFNIK